MDNRKITLIAIIAVIALTAVGIGYAYTATTMNSANNVSATYYTLEQTKYTFENNDNEKFNTLTRLTDLNAVKSDDNPVVKYYQLAGAEDITTAFTTAADKYYGVLIGSDTLEVKPNSSTATTASYDVTISAASGFTDFKDNTATTTVANDGYWVYVLAVGLKENDAWTDVQYAVYTGGDNAWTYLSKTGGAQTKLTLTENTPYVTELYFAGKAQTPNMIGTASTTDAHSVQAPNGTVVPGNIAKIVKDGTITFTSEVTS